MAAFGQRFHADLLTRRATTEVAPVGVTAGVGAVGLLSDWSKKMTARSDVK